jgi:hypothetical protein
MEQVHEVVKVGRQNSGDSRKAIEAALLTEGVQYLTFCRDAQQRRVVGG